MDESSREQHGCFVYRVGNAVPVYEDSSCSRRTAKLPIWQVVSGSQIRSGALKLDDGTGWVKIGQMTRLKVEYTGLRLYRTLHNPLARRYHPDDDSRHESERPVIGLVATHCRVMGSNGAYFIRVDGNPSCWLPETSDDGRTLLQLVEEAGLPVGGPAYGPRPIASVYRGLTVWRVVDGPVAVYPTWEPSGAFSCMLQPGTVISSIIRTVRDDKYKSLMICLEDGAGWVCEQQESGKGRLTPVAIDYVRTRYRVDNGDVGLALRSRPDHDVQFRKEPQTVVKGTVWSYAKVIGSTGDVYVRVEGQAGWLFETRHDDTTLVKLEDDLDVAVDGDLLGENVRVDLRSARQLANRFDWLEIGCNEVSRVVSFSQGDMRVNVYYTTGTVGTCLDHPVQGKTQLFRREVSVGELEAIFRNPRVHLNKGYKRREHMPLPPPPPFVTIGGAYGGGGASLSNGRRGSVVAQSEEEALRAQIAKLEQDARDALEERSSLVWQLAVLRSVGEKAEAKRRAQEAKRRAEEARRRAEEEEERQRLCALLEEERKQREEEARRSALEEARQMAQGIISLLDDDIDDRFDDAINSAVDIKDLAITSDSYIIIYEDGSTAWSGIPKGLDNKLRGRQAWLPRPRHVALGPSDSGHFCVLFEDGGWKAVGPQGLYDAIEDADDVSRVALGPHDTWLVLYKDGSQAWDGGIPTGLYNQLNSRNPKLPKPVFVDLGPDDEWVVAYADGSWRANGYGRCVQNAINDASRSGKVGRVWFGEDGTYVIAYK